MPGILPILAALGGGLSFLSELFGGGSRAERAQYLPIPKPPVIFPNPVLYNLEAINRILDQLPIGGVRLPAPPGFDPNLPLARQWAIPQGWEAAMRRMGYGGWVMPPLNFFDACFHPL
jgi:hypothetical protein